MVEQGPSGHAPVEAGVGGEEADVAAHLGVRPRVAAEHARLAACAAQEPDHDAHRGGLARAVRAEEAADLAGRDGQVDRVEGGEVAEALRNGPQLGNGFHARSIGEDDRAQCR